MTWLIKADDADKRLQQATLLHVDDLEQQVTREEDSLQFGLVHDVIDGLLTHGVEETDRGVCVVHVGDVSHEPLVSVLAPDANKAPRLPVAFGLASQTERHETLAHLLSHRLNLTPGEPFVPSELLFQVFSIFVLLNGQLLTCAEEGLVGHFLGLMLKEVEERFALLEIFVLNRVESFQVVIILLV